MGGTTDFLAGMIIFIFFALLIRGEDYDANIIEKVQEVCVEGTITAHIGFWRTSYTCEPIID